MGTPEFAVASLRALVEGGYQVVAVVTQPDKAMGRHGSVLQAPVVKQYAQEKGIPVLQPLRLKEEAFLEELRSYRAHLQVVVAFRMLPQEVWAMPCFGTFNVHAALLPQYRGAAPINWAIINGERQTGVTTFFLDRNIDTGRIIRQKPIPIPSDADAEHVYNTLMHLGAELCRETVDLVIEGNGVVESTPQQAELDLKPAPKLFKEICQIDWSQPDWQVYNFVRGLSPHPGAWTKIRKTNQDPTVLKIYKTQIAHQEVCGPAGTFFIASNRLYVNTGNGVLELLEVQLAGKKRMQARDFLNGLRDIEAYTAAP